ncbi:aldose 1-epimerase family protein [Rhodoblastus sp.]|uniref:aldose epimerase family protein n=1 Tax=Rhodoblastus sp. TaxID=1962975 RepID=UPI0035AEE721
MSAGFEIASGGASARIARRGAELKSWRVGGRELIWAGDETFWPDSAPILFPVVGWTRDGVVVDGRRYPLGLHGFARHEDFDLVEQAEERLVLRLGANERTHAVYPFAFNLFVEYIIQDNVLSIILHVKSETERPMPYACGLHPGFVWPLPGATGPHMVRFDADERAEVPVIAPGGLFSTRRRPIPLEGRMLPLTPDMFEEALCFLDACSAGLDFGAENGPSLRMELDHFPHIALWSRPGAGFLCLEAWTGHGDPEGFSGDLFAKPSMRVLAPGEKARSAARYIWRP